MGSVGRKDGLEGSPNPLSVPVVRIEGPSSSIPTAAGSIDSIISQFYFAKQLDPRLFAVASLCFVPPNREMWVGCEDGSITVYNVDNYQLVEERECTHYTITCMTFDRIGQVWCGSNDAKVS